MSLFTGIISLIIYIILAIIAASLMTKSALLKGYGKDYHIWAICFWFGLFGILYTISLPDLILQSQNSEILKKIEKSEA